MVYIVEDLDGLVADLAWLERFGKRIIEQHNLLDHRRLYLMLFEDGNRIDLTLCPKEHIKEWVDSEADFTVLDDPQGLFAPYAPIPKRYDGGARRGGWARRGDTASGARTRA